MQTSLFPHSDFLKQPSAQADKASQQSYIKPLATLFEKVTPKPNEIQSNTTNIKKSLDELFPEQQYEEKKIQKTKHILGSIANEYAQGQLINTIIEVEYLTESWLDDFEKEIFQGLTLSELLHERGGK